MNQDVAEVRNLMLAIAHNAIDSRAELDEYPSGEYDAKHDPEGYITSLLNALHQWCHSCGIDWNKELARAQGFFEQDLAESQQGGRSPVFAHGGGTAVSRMRARRQLRD